MKESLKKKMIKSRLKWAGHVKEWEMKTCKATRCPESGGERNRGRPRPDAGERREPTVVYRCAGTDN